MSRFVLVEWRPFVKNSPVEVETEFLKFRYRP